jgi:hypothetical protein
MAKCSAHGAEIGTLYLNTKAYRYMDDGVILRNSGFGWKLFGKLKPGVLPQQAFAKKLAQEQEMLNRKPALRAFRKALHDLAGIGKRWKLVQAISMMPDDCDGVWSECCDGYADNVHADVDDIAELCKLYKAAVEEKSLEPQAK